MIGCKVYVNTINRENGIKKEWINCDIFLRGIENCDFKMANVYDSTIKWS